MPLDPQHHLRFTEAPFMSCLKNVYNSFNSPTKVYCSGDVFSNQRHKCLNYKMTVRFFLSAPLHAYSVSLHMGVGIEAMQRLPLAKSTMSTVLSVQTVQVSNG